MSELSFTDATARAERRLGALEGDQARRSRADRGRARLDPRVERKLQRLLATRERPGLTEVHQELAAFCRRLRLRAPSRATLYNAIARARAPMLAVAALPDGVRRTLHNVGGRRVPGEHVVFAAFNYGSTEAMSYAASLPWLCIELALKMRGFRPKSLALLRAVAHCRGLP
jgi:hypothetical protein